MKLLIVAIAALLMGAAPTKPVAPNPTLKSPSVQQLDQKTQLRIALMDKVVKDVEGLKKKAPAVEIDNFLFGDSAPEGGDSAVVYFSNGKGSHFAVLYLRGLESQPDKTVWVEVDYFKGVR